jgi:hypothetical protein
MDMDVASLRETERQCVLKFQEKARMLRAENPTMSPAIARAKAASMMPHTMEKYLWAVSRLQYAGCQPLAWK